MGINLHKWKPILVMVVVQIVISLVNIFYKLAANDGMNLSILVAYRFLFAAACMLPLAYFLERKKRPKITRKVALYGCLCGVFGGSLGQNLYLQSLVMTSTTFVSAMTNLIPAITFIVAISLRLERLEWSSAAGKAKVLGTMVGISGAMIITFYKGHEFKLWDTHINLLQTTVSHPHHSGTQSHTENGGNKFFVGAILGIVSCVCYSLWLIVQAKAGAEFPCPYSFTAIMTLAASIQCVAVALCLERDMTQWELGWNIRLLASAATGILGSGLMFSLVAWCVRKKGPLFVSIFQPLTLVLVAVAGFLFMEEKLRLGMVIGAILIVIGLYIVLWGKGKEIHNPSESMPENTENEVRVDMPPPLQDAGSHSNRGNAAEEGEVEQAHVDMLPSQNDGNMVEEEREVEAEMPQNDTSRVEGEHRGETESEEPQKKGAEVEEQAGKDLPNECSSSSTKKTKTEVELEEQAGKKLPNESSSNTKKVEAEVELEVPPGLELIKVKVKVIKAEPKTGKQQNESSSTTNKSEEETPPVEVIKEKVD